MAIDKDEIEKYIFDPENPKGCMSYKALLAVARKEPRTFLSPDFLKYFISDKILTEEFNDALWDKPDNYNQLDFFKKISLYINLYTELDFNDYLQNIDIDISSLEKKYKIFNNLVFLDVDNKILQSINYNISILIKNERSIHRIINQNKKQNQNDFGINNL